MSAQQFLLHVELLKALNLGALPTRPPPAMRGIGGQTKTTSAALVPIGLGGTPGLLAVVICPGQTPTLLPLPLMRAWAGSIDLTNSVVTLESTHGRSVIEYLHSGHAAVDIIDGLDWFLSSVPNSAKFVRSSVHEEHVKKVRDAEPQGQTRAVPISIAQELSSGAQVLQVESWRCTDDDTSRHGSSVAEAGASLVPEHSEHGALANSSHGVGCSTTSSVVGCAKKFSGNRAGASVDFRPRLAPSRTVLKYAPHSRQPMDSQHKVDRPSVLTRSESIEAIIKLSDVRCPNMQMWNRQSPLYLHLGLVKALMSHELELSAKMGYT
eukprot:5943414-Amphidinium_carterae.6